MAKKICNCAKQRGRCSNCERRINDERATVKDGLLQIGGGNFQDAVRYSSASLLGSFSFLATVKTTSKRDEKGIDSLMNGLEIIHSAKHMVEGTICGACGSKVAGAGCPGCTSEVLHLIVSKDLTVDKVVALQRRMTNAALSLLTRHLVKTVSRCALSTVLIKRR